MIDLSVLHSITYGVYVITVSNNGKYSGFIANTIMQVTADPVKISAVCSKNNASTAMIADSGKFNVSILHSYTSQKLISTFGYHSSREINKFESIKYFVAPNGVPVVAEDAIAWMECEVEEQVDLCSHIMFIGKMTGGEMINDKAKPMTYDYYHDTFKAKSPKNAPTYQGNDTPSAKSDSQAKPSDPPAKYECTVCGYIYDPLQGDPDNGIAPGTRFEDIPDTWTCPMCGVGKSDFRKI